MGAQTWNKHSFRVQELFASLELRVIIIMSTYCIHKLYSLLLSNVFTLYLHYVFYALGDALIQCPKTCEKNHAFCDNPMNGEVWL